MEINSPKSRTMISSLQAITVKAGIPFRILGCPMDQIYIRVKPVNYLLNSSLITDCINRGKVIVVNLNKGTTFVIEGTREIALLDCSIDVRGDLI